MEIGGFFPYEPNQESENNYIRRMCPNATDVRHLMSGRCAIYYCLQDSLLTDNKKVAYLPSYDCETVLSCFTKSEYEIIYYDIDDTLTPVFDENSIIGFVCGALNGSGALMSCRYTVVSKSPVTDGWNDANSGGTFGPRLREAGYDAVFVKGKAEKPVYILINDGEVEIRSAEKYWGKTTTVQFDNAV